MTNKSPDELSIMSPEQIAAWKEEERRHVFGDNYKTDRQGRPIESGLGSPGNETFQHFQALERAEGKAAADSARQRANKRAGADRW
jgi:hypothetical protein